MSNSAEYNSAVEQFANRLIDNIRSLITPASPTAATSSLGSVNPIQASSSRPLQQQSASQAVLVSVLDLELFYHFKRQLCNDFCLSVEIHHKIF